MKRPKDVIIASGLAMLVLSVMAGLAWACTPQPKIVALGIEGPPAGSTIEVAGEGAGAGSVAQIHWNSLSGPVLAQPEIEQGAFSATITIPDVAPGVYFLVLNSEAGVARTSLEVSTGSSGSAGSTAQSASTVSADLWQGYGSGPAPDLAATPRSDATGLSTTRTAGLALSAVGALALSAAGLTMAVRRRRHAG